LADRLQPISYGLRRLGFAAVAFATALPPSAYDRAAVRVAARQIYFSAWQILPGFTLACAALSWVLIRIVIRGSNDYGLSAYALELTVRVLVLELIPLFAALFVGLRSGAAINTQVALMHIRGELEALQREGGDLLRHELAPRVIGSAVAVTLLAYLNCAVALLLIYFEMYGASPWGLGQFLRITGEVFSPVASVGLGLKTLLFGIAVAVIPISAALRVPRLARMAPVAVLRGMVRLALALVAIEGVFLAITYV
jgi:phospholipid/cholesterol/gamma-HCH transport system permease protein